MLKCEGNPGGNWLVYNRGDKEGSRKGRIYLLYTGQHYDPIRRKPEDGAAVSSVFPIPECKSKFDAAATKVGLQALAAWKIKQRQRTRKAFKCHGCGQVFIPQLLDYYAHLNSPFAANRFVTLPVISKRTAWRWSTMMSLLIRATSLRLWRMSMMWR